MKIRKLLSIISVLFVFGQMAAFAEDERAGQDYSNASVSIKYYNRTVYYPGPADETPVFVHITIKNNGSDTLRFKLADDRSFSMDFNAYTVKNSRLEQTSNIIEKRTTNQTVYFRELALEQGEEYSFVENVKNFLKIEEPSVYYLELFFYPELYKSKYLTLKSNRLTLEVRPSPAAASSNFVAVKNESVEILKPLDISPDKVVAFLLEPFNELPDLRGIDLKTVAAFAERAFCDHASEADGGGCLLVEDLSEFGGVGERGRYVVGDVEGHEGAVERGVFGGDEDAVHPEELFEAFLGECALGETEVVPGKARDPLIALDFAVFVSDGVNR